MNYGKKLQAKPNPIHLRDGCADEARGERLSLQALGAQVRRENHSRRGERTVRRGKGAFPRSPPPGTSVEGVQMGKEIEKRVKVKW